MSSGTDFQECVPGMIYGDALSISCNRHFRLAGLLAHYLLRLRYFSTLSGLVGLVALEGLLRLRYFSMHSRPTLYFRQRVYLPFFVVSSLNYTTYQYTTYINIEYFVNLPRTSDDSLRPVAVYACAHVHTQDGTCRVARADTLSDVAMTASCITLSPFLPNSPCPLEIPSIRPAHPLSAM